MDKAVIYNRVSTKGQEEELQFPKCLELIKKNNWEYIETYQEKESAFKDDSKRTEFNRMIEDAKLKKFNKIVVWNMDRFSRQPEEEVLKLTKILSLMYDVEIIAVNGDVWSEVVSNISKLKTMGFIGEAISEFLEKIIKGLEHQRAHRESVVKSERVKSAIRIEDGITYGRKGGKWGRKGFSKDTIDRVLLIKKNNPDFSLRKIVNHEDCYYYDKNNNKLKLSKTAVHKLLQDFLPKKVS